MHIIVKTNSLLISKQQDDYVIQVNWIKYNNCALYKFIDLCKYLYIYLFLYTYYTRLDGFQSLNSPRLI